MGGVREKEFLFMYKVTHGDNVQIAEKKSLCVSVFLTYDSMCLVLRLIHFRSQS